MRHIVANRILTPDGTMLHSKFVHDYVTHEDANGNTYMTDGGGDYLRRSVFDNAPYHDLDVYADDKHEDIRDAMVWGTYGKYGDEPLKWVLLRDMSDDHVQAIITTQHHLPEWRMQIFKDESKWRAAQ